MKFMVIHFSDNWMMDGIAINYFDNHKAAQKHVQEFKSKSKSHLKDSIRIVQVLEEYKASEIDHGLYGFDTNPKKNLIK